MNRLPRHVAVVLDGNGRWANSRGQPRKAGHVAGVPSLLDLVDGALELGLKELSVFAFSTENWQRDPREVAGVLGVITAALRDHREAWNSNGVRVCWLGRRPAGCPDLVRELDATVALTAANTALTVNACVNYGGRTEIADAARKLARDVAAGILEPSVVDENCFARYLYRPDLPDVDLFIRPSGELRTSNFLPWQSVYAELVFPTTLWPDFTRGNLREAIAEYADRQRRFGNVNEGVLARVPAPLER